MCLPMQDMQEMWVWPLFWEDILKKGTANYSTILICRFPWTEDAGRLQSIGLQRVRHNWVTEHTHSVCVCVCVCACVYQLLWSGSNDFTVMMNTVITKSWFVITFTKKKNQKNKTGLLGAMDDYTTGPGSIHNKSGVSCNARSRKVLKGKHKTLNSMTEYIKRTQIPTERSPRGHSFNYLKQ